MATLPSSKSRPYFAWCNMRRRCSEPSNKSYADYGARGITYDIRWSSFSNFWEDMGKSYADDLMLDRINNEGNYCKENCRWATRQEQNNNTRRNRFFKINGQVKTLAEWVRTVPVKRSTVHQRYYVYGWNIKRSLGLEE